MDKFVGLYNGTQIKTVPMKEKIKALFKEYYNDETMPVVELEDKVLALFDVVGRSEQLVCPECDSDQVIEFFPTHNKRTCFECKNEWAK